MKNVLKRFTGLVLAAVFVFSLAGCGCGYANTPEGVVERVLNAKNNGDYVTQEKYHEDFEATMNEKYNFEVMPGMTMGEWYADMAKENVKDIKSFYQYLADEGRMEYYENQMESAFKDYINAKVEIDKSYAKRWTIEVKEIENNGDEAWVEYTIKTPGQAGMDEHELMKEAAKNLELEDEYNKNELDEKAWKKVIKEWKKLAIEEIKSADLEEEEGEYKVVKIDGTWKIAADQSK